MAVPKRLLDMIPLTFFCDPLRSNLARSRQVLVLLADPKESRPLAPSSTCATNSYLSTSAVNVTDS